MCCTYLHFSSWKQRLEQSSTLLTLWMDLPMTLGLLLGVTPTSSGPTLESRHSPWRSQQSGYHMVLGVYVVWPDEDVGTGGDEKKNWWFDSIIL